MTETDLRLIKTMGFNHVRFPIACEPMLDWREPNKIDPSYLGRIKAVIGLLHEIGLAVIVDIHPESPFKARLAESDEAGDAFAAFWGELAAQLSNFDPEQTFFEILNEPCIGDAARWNCLQGEVIRDIRHAAPEHTMIASGDVYSQLPELLKLDAPVDANVIYNFHLYDPIAFTHQGAGWSPPWAMFTKGLTYPADPAFLEKYLESVADEEAREQLREYEEIGWNAAAYDKMLQEAVAWRDSQGVALTCNEFGVYKKYSPRTSRLQWIKDVVEMLAKNGIGWTMWDYAGDFAVVRQEAGQRTPDREILEALGLGSRRSMEDLRFVR